MDLSPELCGALPAQLLLLFSLRDFLRAYSPTCPNDLFFRESAHDVVHYILTKYAAATNTPFCGALACRHCWLNFRPRLPLDINATLVYTKRVVLHVRNDGAGFCTSVTRDAVAPK